MGKKEKTGVEGKGGGGGKEGPTKVYKVLKPWVFYVTNKRLKVLQISLF